jgi:hypothetical protein
VELPSFVTFPPLVAVVPVTLETAVVVNTGTSSFFLHPINNMAKITIIARGLLITLFMI